MNGYILKTTRSQLYPTEKPVEVFLKELAAFSLTHDARPEWLRQTVVRPATFKYYNFLALLARSLEPQLIVELGTNRGASALHMRWGSPSSRIISVDIVRNPGVQKTLAEHEVEFLHGRSVDMAAKINGRVGLLFIDAEHTSVAVREELIAYTPLMENAGVMVLDDIAHPAMQEVWEFLKKQTGRLKAVDLSELHPTSGFGAVMLEAQA